MSSEYKLNTLIQYYSLIDSNFEETYTLIDADFKILYSSILFNELYNQEPIGVSDNLFELNYFKIQSEIITNTIKKKLSSDKTFSMTTCLNRNSLIVLRQLRFRKIVFDDTIFWEITSFQYKHLNLLSKYSDHYSSYLTSEFISTFKNRFKTFTDYQLTICFLMAHNYSNQKIADTINQINPCEKSRSRTAINAKIERIRKLLDIPSKEVFVECLHRVGILNYFPCLLFNNRVIIH